MTISNILLQHIRQGSRKHVAATVAAATMVASMATLQQEQQTNEETNDIHQTKHRKLPSSSSSLASSHQQNSSTILHDMLQLSSISSTTHCSAAGGFAASSMWRIPSRFRRSHTEAIMRQTKTKHESLESKYTVHWDDPLGEGAFGSVFSATHKTTGERVAIKKISKELVDDPTFQQEMDAMIALREHGGHPNICSLREHFEVDEYYYIILDYIDGRELFEQLCESGPYSEAEAARHIREIASALSFLHGIGIVHSDVKPENIMLSSKDTENAVLKLVDMGNAHVLFDSLDDFYSEEERQQFKGGDDVDERRRITARSPSYCPPEVLRELQQDDEGRAHINPSFDMWSLGVVIYIMLVGIHPFDPRADATSDEIEKRVLSGRKPPLRGLRYTRHLSRDAIMLIEGLMEWDPNKRLTAQQVLENRWVQGETATLKKIANSDQRLSQYRKYKTHIGSTFFKAFLTSSDTVQPERLSTTRRSTSGGNNNNNGGGERQSVLQTAFRQLDTYDTGYVSANDIHEDMESDQHLSYSEASLLLAESMKNRYYPKGHTIYEEGDAGDTLYLIDSGSIQVSTKDGFEKVRESGALLGVNAMMDHRTTTAANSNQKGVYAQTAKCVTPVHVLEIPREVFEKYVTSDHETALSMEETVRHIRRERANAILRTNPECREKWFKKGQTIFKAGTTRGEKNCVFLIDQGEVDIALPGGQKVRSVQPGELTGEHAAYHQKPYNVTAKCASDSCKLHALSSEAMHKVFATNEVLRQDFRDLMLRRDFKKAVCFETHRSFPTTAEEIRTTFDLLDTNKTGKLELDALRDIVQRFDKSYLEEDIRDMLESLDLNKSGSITWEEFNRIFIMDKES